MSRPLPPLIHIPSTIFQDRGVAVLEAVVEYLVQQGYTYHEIGLLLRRDERTIWTVHARVKKKRSIGRHGHGGPAGD